MTPSTPNPGDGELDKLMAELRQRALARVATAPNPKRLSANARCDIRLFTAAVDALATERARAEELVRQRDSQFLRQEDLHRRAQAAESRAEELAKERDALKARLLFSEDGGDVALARADNAEAEITALKARVERYEAPNGWCVLRDRDARRVLGDPAKSFGPNGFTQAEGEGCACTACVELHASAGRRHLSCCAVHNEPANWNGPCDCGALLIPTTERGR